MNGAHIEGMAEDEGDPFIGTEIGQPVPGEHAFGGHHQILAVRFDQTQKRFWTSRDVLMHDNIASRIEDADVHGAGMQIDTAIMLMLLGVKSHDAGSFP